MSLCNVIACADCNLKTVKPDNCPIIQSQLRGNATIVVAVFEDKDIDDFTAIGVSCFKTNKYDELCFVQCSCPSNYADYKISSVKRLTPKSGRSHHEITHGSPLRERISNIS